MDRVGNNSFLQFNTHSLIAHLKPASTITMLAVGVLGAMAATYYDPRKVILGVISLGAVQILTLPQLLENSDHVLARLALISSFAAFGSLVLGSSAIFSYRTFNKLMTDIFAQTPLNIDALFIGGWKLMALISYGMPLGYNVLKKVYTAINDSQFKNKLIHLVNVMRRYPINVNVEFVINNYPLKVRFIEFIIYRFAFILQCFLLGRLIFPHYRPGPNSINPIMEQLQHFNSIYEHIPQEDILQLSHVKLIIESLINDLKISIDSLEKKELDVVVNLLRDQLIQLFPKLISTKQFSQLCKGKIENELNNKAGQFLANFNKISHIERKCIALNKELNKLDVNISQYKFSLNKEIGKDLRSRLTSITQQFTKQRKKIESLYQEKQRWKLFTSHPSLSPIVASFEEIRERVRDRRPGEAKDKLQAIYQDTLNMSSEGQEDSIIAIVAKTIQRLNSQLESMNEETETSAYLFLAANCQFVSRDYDDLKKWLEVKEYANIETKLEEIGLKNEQDLYSLGILKVGEPFNKQAIKVRLEKFIKMRLKRDMRSRIYSVLSGFKPNRTSLSSLIEKVKPIYHAVMLINGLFIVPGLCTDSPLLSSVIFVNMIGGLAYISGRFRRRER